jgi:AcrR family transcriptional regulator
LLDVAMQHFAQYGFETASLNEILADAKLSEGAYYYYFDDKGDLFATVIERELARLLAPAPFASLTNVTPDNFWALVESQVSSVARTHSFPARQRVCRA